MDVPPYAWPIATLSWVRVHDPDAGGRHALDLFCLGDSKVLVQAPDGAVRDLVPFDKYASAAEMLQSPSSAARALAAGVPYIEIAHIPPVIRAFFDHVKQEQQ